MTAQLLITMTSAASPHGTTSYPWDAMSAASIAESAWLRRHPRVWKLTRLCAIYNMFSIKDL